MAFGGYIDETVGRMFPLRLVAGMSAGMELSASGTGSSDYKIGYRLSCPVALKFPTEVAE